MTQTDLDRLLARAKNVKMTPEARERQRRSFAYGNTHAENEKITPHDHRSRSRETLKWWTEGLRPIPRASGI